MATATPQPDADPPAAEPAAPDWLHRTQQRIPKTKAFYERKKKIIEADETVLITKVRDTIRTVEEEDQPRIRFADEGLKTLFIQDSAALRFWSSELTDWLLWALLSACVITIVTASLVAKRMWNIHQPWSQWLWAAVATILFVGVAFLLLVLADIFDEFFKATLPPAIQDMEFFGPPCVFAIVGLFVVHHFRAVSPQSKLTFALSVGVFELSLIIAAIWVWALILRLIEKMIERQTWAAHPRTLIFQNLLDLFPLINWEFQHADPTAKLMQGLERIAYLLEGPMARRLDTGDATTQGWLDDEMKRRAAAFRELKKLAVCSGGQVPERLKLHLEAALVHVCNLDWHLLEAVPVHVISKRERVKQFGQRLLKAATVSIVPVAILVARLSVGSVQQFDKTNVILIGTVAWLAINLLSAFDPEYGLTKQGLDLLSKVPGVGGARGGGAGGGEH